MKSATAEKGGSRSRIHIGTASARNLSERLGVEPKGAVLRVGLVHYNTSEDVDRLLRALDEFATR